MIDLRERQRIIEVNRRYMVEVSRLERLLDDAHVRNGEYNLFVHMFKERYPNEYKDIVLEYKKSHSLNHGGLQNES